MLESNVRSVLEVLRNNCTEDQLPLVLSVRENLLRYIDQMELLVSQLNDLVSSRITPDTKSVATDIVRRLDRLDHLAGIMAEMLDDEKMGISIEYRGRTKMVDIWRLDRNKLLESVPGAVLRINHLVETCGLNR